MDGPKYEFTCYEIAKARFEGGVKKSKNNFMFKCPVCGKSKLGVDPEKNYEHGGVWNCLSCQVGGNRFELAAFILGLKYPKDSGPVHFWIKNMMEKHYGKVIQFSQPPPKKHSITKPKVISRVGRQLMQEPGLMILPSLAKVLTLQKAAILQDIHFLCRYYGKDAICRSISEWQARLCFLHHETVSKALRELAAENLIEKKKKGAQFFWAISYNNLEMRILDALHSTSLYTYSNTANRA